MARLAFSSNAFKRHSLEYSIREIARLGYSGVEILCDVPHAYPPSFGDDEIRSTREIISSSGLQISNLNAFTLYAIGDVYHPSWIAGDQRLRDIRTKHTMDCLRMAAKLGAKSISTEPGGPPVGGESSDRKIFLKGLREAAAVAEEVGVKILVEPEPGLLVENSRQFTDLMKAIDSDSVKLNFDIGHFYCVGEDPAGLIQELSEYIEHFHLADIASSRVHNHLIPGLGSIDFGPIFDAMDAIGYGGFVTVELYPYQDDPIAAAAEAHRFLESVLPNHR